MAVDVRDSTQQPPVQAGEAKTVPYNVYNVATYLHDVFTDDVAEFIANGKVTTGYANLDVITNLYPGLYVLGAISSLGKTTFIHQMCDQMAEAGEFVIFFSLEQSVLELTSKSLSRTMAIKDKSTALTSLQIRKTEDLSKLDLAMQTYGAYANRVTIVECSFAATIDDITDYVESYIKARKVKPVVIIDYLQVIQASDDCFSTKDAVDSNVKKIKQLQSDNKLIVLVISSLNRQNYLSTIDYESFKESGGIEYTADVVWGLQLQVLHEDIFDKAQEINKKRKRIREAKAENPRRVELVCLKNRFGVSSYSCLFYYYPQFDLFIPDLDGLDTSKLLNCDKDGFTSLPEGFTDPFD